MMSLFLPTVRGVVLHSDLPPSRIFGRKMYTANKINVADRDDASLVKTISGGVDEPSDPKHFPELGNSATSPRAISRLGGSFKEKLMSDCGEKSGDCGHEDASGSEAAKVDVRGSQESRSPRISAGRESSGVVVEGGVLEERGCSGKARQQEDTLPVMTERDCQSESWEPVSPRKHISQRRRTADQEAERAAKAGTIFDFPSHPNTFGALAEHNEKVPEVSPEEERDGDKFAHEGLDKESRMYCYGWTGGHGGVLERVEAGVQWVMENPVKAATVVGITMGAMFFMRRRRRF